MRAVQMEMYYWCIKTLTKLGVQFEDVPNSSKKKNIKERLNILDMSGATIYKCKTALFKASVYTTLTW